MSCRGLRSMMIVLCCCTAAYTLVGLLAARVI